MKKFGKIVVASIMAGTMAVTPVYASDIDGLRAQKQEAQSEANSLQKELERALGQISRLEDNMLVKKEEIDQATVDLDAACVKEEKQYEAMKIRIRYMYEDGGKSALEKIFTAGSITELLNQVEYVQTLHSYDRKMLNEYIETKNQIADLKDQLVQEEKEMQELDKKLTAESQQLSATLDAKRGEVANLDDQLQKAIIAEQKRKEEEARKREEEKKKQEEANKKPSNNNSNSNNNNSSNNNSSNNNSSNNNNSNNSSNNNNNSSNNNNSNNSSSNNNSSNNKPGNEDKPVQKPEEPSKPEQKPSEPAGNKNAAAVIVSAAYSQLGVPYEWGGTTPGVGLDCSGLTSYCHRVAGIIIPRTSSGQLAAGRRVTDPQPGDICWTPGHVAIYIGGGKMIEAPDVGQVVKISNVRVSVYLRFW